MSRHWPFDAISIPVTGDRENRIAAAQEAFRLLDRLTGRTVADRVRIADGTENRAALSAGDGEVKQLRILRCTAERVLPEAFVDIGQPELTLWINAGSDRLAAAVLAAYEACTAALRFEAARARLFRHTERMRHPSYSARTAEEVFRETCGGMSEDVMKYALPHLNFVTLENGLADFAYRDPCTMRSLFDRVEDADLRCAMQILSVEYGQDAEDARKAVRQALAELRAMAPEAQPWCAVPFQDGYHGGERAGYSRIRFACVELERFLREFHPISEGRLDDYSGRNRVLFDDPTAYDEIDAVYPGEAENASFRRAIREQARLLTADRAHIPELMGMDITRLSLNERRMMTVELLVGQALPLPGREVPTQENYRLLDIYSQLSCLWFALESRLYEERLFPAAEDAEKQAYLEAEPCQDSVVVKHTGSDNPIRGYERNIAEGIWQFEPSEIRTISE